MKKGLALLLTGAVLSTATLTSAGMMAFAAEDESVIGSEDRNGTRMSRSASTYTCFRTTICTTSFRLH